MKQTHLILGAMNAANGILQLLSRNGRHKDGEKKERAHWHDCKKQKNKLAITGELPDN